MKKTMKQHSFTTRLKSLAVVFGIAMAFASCANEDVAQNPTNPNEDNDKNLTTFVAGDETKTRTTMDYNSGNFYWEKDDYIYVKDDNGVLQKSTNAPDQKVAAFKYKVPGKFTASSSYKVYYLGKNSNGSSVSISTAQSQTSPDNTEHFGTVGDYGTATATGTLGGKSFSFALEHQPAYLVFQPYTSNTILQNCYLTAVEVTSDDDIAEKYTVNPTTGALDASAVTDGNKIVLTTRSSSNPNGFPLTNNTASVTTNGAYMIIKPGTHTLKVRYWVQDLVTHVEGTITKILPSKKYDSNTYYDMTTNLNVTNYDGDHYFMWDAQEQYWKGYEWNHGGSQPTIPSNLWYPGATTSNDYPKSNADPRWCNESYPGFLISNPATHTSCKDLPNVNELTWYADKGEPRWDDDELWTTMGHLYKGGIWFKKKAYISGYNKNTAYDGTDWRTSPGGGGTHDWTTSQTLPSAADAGKYFYLPALGSYVGGQLLNVGMRCDCWSSSARPYNTNSAYFMYFRNGAVFVGDWKRDSGGRALAFE